MNNEIRWLARLGIDQGLFDRGKCLALHKALGEEACLKASNKAAFAPLQEPGDLEPGH